MEHTRRPISLEWARSQTRQVSWQVKGAIAGGALVLAMTALGFYWSLPQPLFDVGEVTEKQLAELGSQPVTGSHITATAIHLGTTLLDKPGGYLSNDQFPPGSVVDNMPNWEFGVVLAMRDYLDVARNDLSRAQSQSREDPDLIVAQPQFNYNSESWILPSTESEYRKGLDAITSYFRRLSSDADIDAQFYARADNLVALLDKIQKRLGNQSQKLSYSVGRLRSYQSELSGSNVASQSTQTPTEVFTKTKWDEVDDVFYEARGYTWATLHLLKAAKMDFAAILKSKNATPSLDQIIMELQAVQKPIYSPVILNGSGNGVFANHSLVISSYISRANAGLGALIELLRDG